MPSKADKKCYEPSKADKKCYENLLISWSDRDLSADVSSQIETVRKRLKKDFKTPLSGPKIVEKLHAENKLGILPKLPNEVLLHIREYINSNASMKNLNELEVARFMDSLGFLKLQLPKDIDSDFFVYHKEDWLKRYFPLLTKELLIESHFLEIIDQMCQAGKLKESKHDAISKLYHDKGWSYFKNLLEAHNVKEVNKEIKRSDRQIKIYLIKQDFKRRKADLFWGGLGVTILLWIMYYFAAIYNPSDYDNPVCEKLGLNSNWNNTKCY